MLAYRYRADRNYIIDNGQFKVQARQTVYNRSEFKKTEFVSIKIIY